MLTRKNASLLLIATLAEITANLQAQEPELPLTRSMGAACYCRRWRQCYRSR